VVARQHSYLDPKVQYVLRSRSAPNGAVTITVNSNPKELLLLDFLPKWKGKIEARDARVPGPGTAHYASLPQPALGPIHPALFSEMEILYFVTSVRDRTAGRRNSSSAFLLDIPKPDVRVFRSIPLAP